MNNLQVFRHSEFGEMGVLLIEGREYFPATACAKILGYTNPHKAIKDHCREEGVTKREGVSRTTNQYGVTTEQKVTTNYITEGNLYRLIFRSKLPAAQRFEDWVVNEVLPAIRKNGHYSVGGELPLDKVMEIIQMTAAAMMTEFVKQVVPIINNVTAATSNSSAGAEYAEYSDPMFDKRCKLERFPSFVREQVNSMLEEMLEEQSLNFSRIARFCTIKGFPISSPSVKTYFTRHFNS